MEQSKIEKIKLRVQKENTKAINLSKLDILNIIIGTIGLLTPYLYLIGMAYNEAYFNVFGLETTLFPITPIETYIYAYHIVVILATYILTFIFIIPVALHVTGTLHWLISLIIILLIKYFDFKIINSFNNWIKSWLLKLIQKITSYSRIRLSITFIIFIVFSPFGAFKLGEFKSTEDRDNYLENGCFYKKNNLWSNCNALKAKNGEILYKGLMVASTKEHVAFFNCEGTVIKQIPKGASIIKELKKLKNKSEKKSNPYCESAHS